MVLAYQVVSNRPVAHHRFALRPRTYSSSAVAMAGISTRGTEVPRTVHALAGFREYMTLGPGILTKEFASVVSEYAESVGIA